MNPTQIMSFAHRAAGLSGPEADSAVVVDAGEIHRAAAGLDIATAELITAWDMECGLVIGHHADYAPGSLQAHRSFATIREKMIRLGVHPAQAGKIIRELQTLHRRGRSGNSSNYDRVPSIARLISMPLMNIATPADRIGENRVEALLEETLPAGAPARLSDVMEALRLIPECALSISPPALYVGAEGDYAGKPAALFSHIAAESPSIATALFEAGVGTLILPYAAEAVIAAVKEQNIGNLIALGHVTADSIGMNAVLRELERQGVEVIRFSGIIDSGEGRGK